MNDKEMLDIYTDYLISSFGLTTGTGLSKLMNGSISHDQIQRFLARPSQISVDLWWMVKPYLRQIEALDGVLIVDDSIAEKPYTDENDIICWHYDHSKDRNVKGINFITALYHAQETSLPVGLELVAKTETYHDAKTDKMKCRSPLSKNERYQILIRQAKANQIQFRYVLNDVWFASADNMMFIKHEIERDFIMPLKSNRKLALSLADKRAGLYLRLDSLELTAEKPQTIYLEGVDFPLLLVKQVFTNEDGSLGILYWVTSDVELSYELITTIYKKRWNVEPYHQSLKQNARLEKSPTRTIQTQSNHLLASVCAFIKLEWLKRDTASNHFALKSKLYLQALRVAFASLQELKPIRFSA